MLRDGRCELFRRRVRRSTGPTRRVDLQAPVKTVCRDPRSRRVLRRADGCVFCRRGTGEAATGKLLRRMGNQRCAGAVQRSPRHIGLVAVPNVRS
jgi:hypothetical protein